MPSLLEVQRGFAQGMLAAGEGAPWVLEDALSAAERLAIYRNTFAGVIVNAMRLTYPVVARLVGAEFFEGAVQLFLADNPPRSAYLNDYGDGFDGFLARLPQAAGLRYLPDVARLEWAVAGAALAADAPMLDPVSLTRFRPEELEALRLSPHPSLRIVTLTTPADAIWRAIDGGNEDALAAIRIEGPPFALVMHRGAEGIMFRRLSEPEHRLTAALAAGAPIGAAFAAVPEVDATALLAEHLATGRFSGAMLMQASA